MGWVVALWVAALVAVGVLTYQAGYTEGRQAGYIQALQDFEEPLKRVGYIKSIQGRALWRGQLRQMWEQRDVH